MEALVQLLILLLIGSLVTLPSVILIILLFSFPPGSRQVTIDNLKRRQSIYALTRTRSQIVASVVVFVLAFAIMQWIPVVGSRITISGSDALDFFSTISQALAALIGLLLAVLIFAVQRREGALTNAYQAFRDEAARYSTLRIALHSGETIPELDVLDRLIVQMARLTPQELVGRQGKDHHTRVFALSSDLLEHIPKLAKENRGGAIAVQSSITTILIRRKGVLQWASALERGDSTYRDVADLLYPLGVSLVLFLVFAGFSLPETCPALGVGIISGFLTWVLAAMRQIAVVGKEVFIASDLDQLSPTPESDGSSPSIG